MKRQYIKCNASPDMVKKHSETLENLNERTIRIETAAYTTIALITLFGIIIAFIEYGKKQPEKTAMAETKIEPAVSVAGLKDKGKHEHE